MITSSFHVLIWIDCKIMAVPKARKRASLLSMPREYSEHASIHGISYIFSAANEVAFAFDAVKAKGVNTPKVNSISFFCLNLCIKLFSAI